MGESGANGFWKQVLLAMVVPLAVALIAFGALQSRVTSMEREIESKAPREVVSAEYESLLREIQALRLDVQQLRHRP